MEAGRFYHIYNRGNNREIIFKEEKNYLFFLERASVPEWFGGRKAFLDFHEQYGKYHEEKERDFSEFEDD